MKQFPKLLVVVFFVSVIISAIVIVSTRNIPYFNEYNPTIQIGIKPEIENKEEVFTNVRTLENISAVNTKDQKVSIQNSSIENVTESLASKSLIEDVVIQEIYFEKSFASEINSTILISLIVFLITFVAVFMFHVRNQKRSVYLFMRRVGSTYFDSMISILVIFTGILLLVSRVYELKSIDLMGYILASLLGTYIIFSATYRMKFVQSEEVRDIDSEIYNSVQSLLNGKIIILLLIFIPVLFGLGTNFVMPAILLIASYLVTVGSFYSILWIRKALNNFSVAKTKLVNEGLTENSSLDDSITRNTQSRRRAFHNKNVKKKK